jgi:hypothetical protein
MPYVVGIVLSLSVALFARGVGFDRDRAFYPTVLIVIASYYVLFAAMSESVHTVLLESMVMAGFSIAAVVGRCPRRSLIWSRACVHVSRSAMSSAPQVGTPVATTMYCSPLAERRARLCARRGLYLRGYRPPPMFVAERNRQPEA